MTTLSELALDDLRAERHRLAEEVARLSWLRRLVVARTDLEVARLTGVVAGPQEVPCRVRDALALEAAAVGPELLGDLAASARSLGASASGRQQQLDAATRELVERYTQDPARCLAVPGPTRAAGSSARVG